MYIHRVRTPLSVSDVIRDSMSFFSLCMHLFSCLSLNGEQHVCWNAVGSVLPVKNTRTAVCNSVCQVHGVYGLWQIYIRARTSAGKMPR